MKAVMASSPSRFVQHRLALLPDGDLAETALDSRGNAWARWRSSGEWSRWWALAGGAIDVSVTAAVVAVEDSTISCCYVTVTFDRGGAAQHPDGRAVYSLSVAGPVPGRL
jgi:hypothetical protein